TAGVRKGTAAIKLPEGPVPVAAIGRLLAEVVVTWGTWGATLPKLWVVRPVAAAVAGAAVVASRAGREKPDQSWAIAFAPDPAGRRTTMSSERFVLVALADSAGAAASTIAPPTARAL
ncbi:MAG: hypothetical protein ACRC1J_07725, partial [Sandaracinobacteroides sp.]